MSHSHPKQPDTEDSPMGYHERLAVALRELLIEKGLVSADDIRRQIELIDSRSPAVGARVVARAWVDPEFRKRLLADAGYPQGFDYRAEVNQKIFEMGDEVALSDNPTLFVSFSGVIESLPGTANFIGDWKVSGRIVKVTEKTVINAERGRVVVGAHVIVSGALNIDGPGNAQKIVAATERACRDLDIFQAKSVPPQTTRARLRGEFIRRAQERRRDFTVDWVHLKLNDQAQRTVLCKDPFRAYDERVERLIASM